MELIAITPPYFYAGEAEAISRRLASGGYARVHVRKPGCSEADMRRLLEAIPINIRARISLHDRHELAAEYGLGGVHLNSRSPMPPDGWHGIVSRSIHSIDEIDGVTEDYALLSPVYPSISKPGYRGTLDLAAVSVHPGRRIYALGGVTRDKLPELQRYGFAGAAMLGAAWRREIDPEAFALQFITHGAGADDICASARTVARGGCRWIQLRMKGAAPDEVLAVARLIAPLRASHGVTLLVDDHVELAAAHDWIDGVHVGKNDMPVADARRLLGPGKILGATANTFDDLRAAVAAGADYVGLGPFRFTTTKQNLSPVLGLAGYADIMVRCRREGIAAPVVAIGGITGADVADIMRTGVSGIAVSGSILRADDPAEETRKLLHSITAI